MTDDIVLSGKQFNSVKLAVITLHEKALCDDVKRIANDALIALNNADTLDNICSNCDRIDPEDAYERSINEGND